MKNYVIAALSGAALILSSQVMAADIEAGKSKAAEVCASCHGADGNSPAPAFPKIGGQYRTYLVKAERQASAYTRQRLRRKNKASICLFT